MRESYIKKNNKISSYIICAVFFFTAFDLWAQEGNSKCFSVLPQLSSAAIGSFVERESRFKSIIESCPSLAEAHYNYAVLLLENNDFPRAVAEFEEALKLRDEANYRLGLASALLAKGDLLTAKSHFDNLLAKDARSLRALLGVATVLEKSSKPIEALDFLNRAYSVEPENIYVNYNLGVLYDRLNQSDASIVSFERALRSNPKHAPSQFYLGLALKKAGRVEEASAALKKASELPGATVEAISSFALDLEEAGLLDESEIVLRRALSTHSTDERLLEQLSVILLRKSQESNAKPFIEKLLVIRPGDPRILSLYGWAHLRLGDFASAEKVLTEATVKDPAGAFGFFALGELFRQTGRLERSKTNFEIASKLEPSLKEKDSEWWKFW